MEMADCRLWIADLGLPIADWECHSSRMCHCEERSDVAISTVGVISTLLPGGKGEIIAST
jgi:hypothetical protein